MNFKIKSLLLKADFIGFIPQLKIFEQTRINQFFHLYYQL